MMHSDRPRNSIEEVIQKLENAAKTLFQQFRDNRMKDNLDKFQYLYSSNSEAKNKKQPKNKKQ